jgi:Glucodextranase, domain B/Bacterial Ig-like domain/Bacterial Ig domain
MIRRIVAFVLTYTFWATSLWAYTPAQYLPATRGAQYIAGAPLRSLAALNAMNRATNAGAGAEMAKAAYTPKIFSNLAELNAAADGQAGSGGATTSFNFFGPQEYVRTTGDPNTYVTTVSVPAWVASPFNLHIQSGEADGTYRVSSATVSVNSTEVAVPTDFNQNVFTLDRSVTLTPTTTLTVTLASKPGSYLRINLAGTNQDRTAPFIKVDLPGAINNTQPRLVLEYQDAAGAGEPAASGVDPTTLKVTVDGVDRTALFTKRATDADANWPASLAFSVGPHTIAASIQDRAGNVGQTTLPFQVDLTPPTLQIIQPVAGSFLATTTPIIQLAYADNLTVDPASLKVVINGTDRSTLFSRTTGSATAVLDASSALLPGANTIVATVSDTAGNASLATASFNVDIQPPVISIVHPSQNSRHGSSSVEFSIEYADDQAINPTTLQVFLDGNSLAVTANASAATASATLQDGNHTVTATIKDRAGNSATASSSFSVDTAAPAIHITAPAAGAILNVPAPQIVVTYSDTDLDVSTFHFFIDGVDKTAQFNVGATGATATGLALGEGGHTLTAQISDLTGNQGLTSNSVVIDTVKPVITVVAPTGAVNTPRPSAQIQYSDSGSGVDLSTIHIALDGTDVTSIFSTAANSAAAVLGGGTPLAEGTHQLQVSIADRAGNVASITPGAQFVVDLTPPQANFTAPANDSFTNNTQPAITLSYSDALSGVDPSSVHLFLQQGTAPEVEITQLFAVGATQATATIPASSALAQATYHLRAQIADKAGNIPSTPVQSTFVVDTTPPVCTIDAPAVNAYLKSSAPALHVSCSDDNSGIDPAKFSVLLDGADVTAQLTASETGISGSFSALADGTHNVQVTAFDRAGNQAPGQLSQFLVDTTAPVISITSPANAAFTNNNHTPVAVSFSDSGSGIDVTSFKLTIDGIDHSAEFTPTLTGATGSPATVLSEGTHLIIATISDLAANPNSTTVSYIVDTVPPQISVAQPQDGSFTNANSIVVSGTVTDASAVTLTIEGASVPLSGSAFASATIPLGAGPAQAVHITAVDAAGNTSSTTVNVNIDRVPPTIVGVITPAPNAGGWNNTDVVVTFTCSDDRSGVAICPAPVAVTSEGANQIVNGAATDRAGNSAQASVKVSLDRTPPSVTASAAPAANAAGWNNSNVTVTFTCSDSLSGVKSCPPTTVVSTEGQNQSIPGQAVDNAGNTASAGVTLSIDKTAPTFLTLTTPDHISRLHGGQVSATVSDNFTVTQVVLSVNGAPLGTFTTAPYQANLVVPAGANPGDTLTVTATATDEAGNVQTSSRSVRVAADGVIVGQVLDDVTGFPLESASVQVISQTGVVDQTDKQGRYSLQANDPHLFLSVTGSSTGQPTTSVEREIFVQEGVGTVPVDARLTTLPRPLLMGLPSGLRRSPDRDSRDCCHLAGLRWLRSISGRPARPRTCRPRLRALPQPLLILLSTTFHCMPGPWRSRTCSHRTEASASRCLVRDRMRL